MVNEKGTDSGSRSSLVKMNGKETGVACQGKDVVESSSKEVANGANALGDTKNGKNAMEEEKNEENGSVEEENEGDKMEEGKKNEANATEEEEDKEWNETDEDDDDEEDGDEEEEQEVEEEKGEEKEENAIEQEEEKVGANSKEDVQRSRKRDREKKMEEEEDEEEEGEENEENTNKQENKKVGANSGEKVKRPRKRGRKNKMAGMGSETLATKAEDKPGPSEKKKASKRAESMGMIFMCSSKTKKDCYRYNILGLPASKRDIVQKIYKGMRLFLYDFDLKLMYGIYKAAGPGGYNIEPKAFKSAFPSQVRFTVLDDCLPLAEEKFKTVIKENYYGKNKFDCELTSQQVKELCKLFSVSGRGSKSKKLSRKARTETRIARAEPRIARAEPRIARAEPRIARAEPRIRADRGRIRQRSRDEERRSSALVADRRHREARPTTYDRETYRRQRRNRDEERRSPLAGAHRHHDHPIMYERELAPLHRLPPLPPPTAGARPYASYGRTVELDAYGRTLELDAYGRTLELDAYGRDLVAERRDPRLLDLDARHRDEIGSRGRDPRLLDLDARHRDEIGSRDPYLSYREIPSYRETLYPPAVRAAPEYYPPVEPRAEYRLAAPPPSEYRHLGAAPSEYDRLQPLYRY